MVEVKLVVVGGGTEGDEFSPTLPAVLGRSREASLPLPHPLVSRLHCELLAKGDSLFVRDLGSTNGTFVGSERVENERVIEHGALLTIGTVTFRALYQGLPAPADTGPDDEPVHDAGFQDDQIDTASISRVDTGTIGVPKTTKHSSMAPGNRQRAK